MKQVLARHSTAENKNGLQSRKPLIQWGCGGCNRTRLQVAANAYRRATKNSKTAAEASRWSVATYDLASAYV